MVFVSFCLNLREKKTPNHCIVFFCRKAKNSIPVFTSRKQTNASENGMCSFFCHCEQGLFQAFKKLEVK